MLPSLGNNRNIHSFMQPLLTQHERSTCTVHQHRFNHGNRDRSATLILAFPATQVSIQAMAPAPQTGTGDPTDSTPTSTSSTSTAEVAVIIVWILCCVVLFIVGVLISKHRRRMATVTEIELDDQSDVSRLSTDTYESRAPRQVPAPVRTLISILFLTPADRSGRLLPILSGRQPLCHHFTQFVSFLSTATNTVFSSQQQRTSTLASLTLPLVLERYARLIR